MAGNFVSFFLSFLLIATSFQASLAEYGITDGVEAVEDLLIRQVVDGGEDGVLDENFLLNADHHFEIFKRRFNKAYRTQKKHDFRFSVFRANLHRARRHQKLDPSAVHGVTQFSDLTSREFRSQFLGVNRRLGLPSDAHKAEIYRRMICRQTLIGEIMALLHL